MEESHWYPDSPVLNGLLCVIQTKFSTSSLPLRKVYLSCSSPSIFFQRRLGVSTPSYVIGVRCSRNTKPQGVNLAYFHSLYKPAASSMCSTPRTIVVSQISLINIRTAYLTRSFAKLSNHRSFTSTGPLHIAHAQSCSSLISFHSSPATPNLQLDMSDDASYSSFLDKANQETGVSPLNSGPKSAQAPNPKSYSSSNVPSALQNVNVTYTSDTDSPFEAVSFEYDGAELPSAQEFEKLVAKESTDNGPARAEELTVKDFDPKGEYDDLVKKVEGLVEHKKVKVYRVGR